VIKFNVPYQNGMEDIFMKGVFDRGHFQSGGKLSDILAERLESLTKANRVFPVQSCTAALEIAALALDIQPGDEVIMPSYTYVSTGNAFALRGARLVFVDIDPLTMNIDLGAVESAITDKTRVVVPVHYGGVSCDMDRLMALSNKHGFYVVEDAAQSINSRYKDRHLGTIGHFGCVSCHETKNIHGGGEGGLLFVNDETFTKSVEQIIEKGTNRRAFLNNEVDRYTWQTLGYSYGMGELNACFYLTQLQSLLEITSHRRKICELYRTEFFHLRDRCEWLVVPTYNKDNGHVFYLKLRDEKKRSALKNYLKRHDIESVSHYEPLHLSPAGKQYGYFSGTDKYTTKDAARLLRLPVHNHLSMEDAIIVAKTVRDFFKEDKEDES
jgi:dTDP-4-amino-4,6-dideoxygalactose transaminase